MFRIIIKLIIVILFIYLFIYFAIWFIMPLLVQFQKIGTIRYVYFSLPEDLQLIIKLKIILNVSKYYKNL